MQSLSLIYEVMIQKQYTIKHAIKLINRVPCLVERIGRRCAGGWVGGISLVLVLPLLNIKVNTYGSIYKGIIEITEAPPISV